MYKFHRLHGIQHDEDKHHQHYTHTHTHSGVYFTYSRNVSECLDHVYSKNTFETEALLLCGYTVCARTVHTTQPRTHVFCRTAEQCTYNCYWRVQHKLQNTVTQRLGANY